ncbi:MAG: hypothetical protein ACP5KA_07045 [Desulfurococcaceae archaeon]
MDRQKVASVNIRKKYLEGGGKGKKPKMRGLSHSYDPDASMTVELWVGVTPSGRKPMMWAPMKGALKTMKPRVEGQIN